MLFGLGLHGYSPLVMLQSQGTVWEASGESTQGLLLRLVIVSMRAQQGGSSIHNWTWSSLSVVVIGLYKYVCETACKIDRPLH